MSSLRQLRGLRRRQRGNSGQSKPPTITPPTPELIASFISNHNTQEHSPLFNQIPPEIRNTIFLYALLSYEDLSTVYPEDEHYSRPDYRHTSRIDPRILQTCRLIYLESRFLPVMATEHVFWCHRAPPGITYASNPLEYFARFTEEQKNRVDRVHFFTQQYYLEGDFPEICKLPSMRPRSLKITLRHGDWWWWEDNHPLHLNDVWSTGSDYSTRLEEVILELETMERDKEQIYAIAERIKKYTHTLNNGKTLSTAGNPIVKKEWMGPSRLSDLYYDKARDKWTERDLEAEQGVPDPGMKYCIVVIRWTICPEEEE
ncbi:uncharacterized protein C8R40DRAFT_1068316 [Lentinula edodes]|uniref:uncharacterized protein n=1 Tax=Lentinula edodes TaxID=5353 RepID=UPI001E8D6870|nr:uncharacterized protein C8R40DRAFT_1068316 [Lentinula edodes]KAH7877114.1 hypothetical protein C8R40DRAFT_1068316 [Lentinula edodes]